MSVTLKVRAAAVTGADGVPLMTPVEAFSDSPAGKVPVVSDQVYGVVPPEAASIVLYQAPTWPPGSEAVVMLTAVLAVLLVGDRASAPRIRVLMTAHKSPEGRESRCNISLFLSRRWALLLFRIALPASNRYCVEPLFYL